MLDVLISVKPEFVSKILSGDKSIEIRNRPVNLIPGTRIWIYSTLPKGCLEAVAIVQSVVVDSPTSIWSACYKEIGVSQAVFYSYVNGAKKISAIFLTQVCELIPSLPLNLLRSEIENFRPPQFLKRIDNPSSIFHLLEEKRVELRERNLASLSIK